MYLTAHTVSCYYATYLGPPSTICSSPLLNSFCPHRNYRGIISKYCLFGPSYQYPRPDSISLIQVEFFRFQQGLSVTGHAIPISLAAQNYIAEVLDRTGTEFGLKIPSFQSPSLTMKESVFRVFN